MHLFRGSGLKGLCGMAPRRAPYIRPLLGLRRQELEAYLRSLGQPWRTDATNLLPDGGTRNRIRLVLLPYVAQYINPEVDQALARTAASPVSYTHLDVYKRQAARDALSPSIPQL